MFLVNSEAIIKKAYKIAVIPGDDIGKEVIAAGAHPFYHL
jgi:hypothetical protein